MFCVAYHPDNALIFSSAPGVSHGIRFQSVLPNQTSPAPHHAETRKRAAKAKTD